MLGDSNAKASYDKFHGHNSFGTICHAKRRQASREFVGSTKCPKSQMELLLPVVSMCGYDLPKNILQDLIGGLGLAICLRVVHSRFFMNDHMHLCKLLYDFVKEFKPLISDKFDQTVESSNDELI